MAADFDKPTKDSTYLNYSDEILDLAAALGKMDHAASSNPPTGLIQLKPGDLDRFQRYNGATYDPVLLKQVDTDEDSYAGFSADDIYKINIAGQDKLIFDTTGISLDSVAVKDENNMVSDSDKHLCTQQSIKKYIDDQITTYFAANTIILFGQQLSPTGWTKEVGWQDNAMLCINTEADNTALGSGGARNPQSAHGHADTLAAPAHSHADTLAAPSHTHTTPNTGWSSTNPSGNTSTLACIEAGQVSRGATAARTGSGPSATALTGSVGAQSSTTLTGGVSNSSQPYYQEVIACSKD